MLCITGYSQEYINECRARVNTQLAAYQNLLAVATQNTPSDQRDAAVESFEPVFFNNMILVLDNLFVHRSRVMEKKDGNPLNEVRVLCNSLLNDNSKMTADKGIRLDPAKSILKIKFGDEIKLTEADFVRLSDAFFAEIEHVFLQVEALPT